MNWLITGGCGFIGKNLIKSIQTFDSTISIRVLDNLKVGTRKDLHYAVEAFDEVTANHLSWDPGKLQLIVGDILDADLAVVVTQGADVVVHLAANTGVGPSVENPRMDCTNNVLGTFNYLEGCRINKVNKFIFASSGAPIGECIPPIHEELACHPVSPYGASKLAGEAYCSAYNRTFGVQTVALRFGNVYGPGSTHKSSVVAKFIRKALMGETLEIYGDGTQTRDFIFTGDLVRAIWLAATKENIGGEVYQIATSRETTVLEVTEQVLKVLKEESGIEAKVIHGEKRLGDVMRNFSDTTKAKEQLGWVCETNLRDGLRHTLKWFLESKHIVTAK